MSDTTTIRLVISAYYSPNKVGECQITVADIKGFSSCPNCLVENMLKLLAASGNAVELISHDREYHVDEPWQQLNIHLKGE